jgi:hypothetical protein
MNGQELRQIPDEKINRPDRELLKERFEKFLEAS